MSPIDPARFRATAKAELHLHLEGSFTPSMALQLAQKRSDHPWKELTEHGLADCLAASRGFTGFIDQFMTGYALLNTATDYQHLTECLLDQLEQQGVVRADVLYSPGFNIQRRGVPLLDIHDGIQAGLRHSAIDLRMALDTVINLGPSFTRHTLNAVLQDRRAFLQGFSIGGGDPSCDLEPLLGLFEVAQRSGLRCFAHVGEVDGPDNINILLDNTDLERIAHACRAVEDPALLKRLAQRRVAVDVCLSSNLRTGVVADLSRHPVKQFARAGIPFSLSTDDPFYFQTELRREYEQLDNLFGTNDWQSHCAESLRIAGR